MNEVSTRPELKESEQIDHLKCRYCCETISKGARICKTCGEPLYFWLRATRFTSTVLTAFVAIGSLVIAYMQHQDMRQANLEAEKAKQSEAAQSTASEDVVRQLSSLYHGVRTNSYKPNELASTRLNEQALFSPEFKSIQNISELQRNLTTNQGNVNLRKEILLREFMNPKDTQ